MHVYCLEIRGIYRQYGNIKTTMKSEMLVLLIFVLFVVTHLVNGECHECTVPTAVYDDLKCTPQFSDLNTCCPLQYDCSQIYNRPNGTCHFKGKIYKIGKSPDREDIASDCSHASCTCGDTGIFDCIRPSDTCAEFWVPDFVKPGCYLTYEHNRCCSVGQKCAPFNTGDAKCQVGEITYKKGEKFKHPTKKCVSCICDTGFNGSLDSPTCQKLNCTTEARYSDKLQKYCAPYYRYPDDCCPRSWVCSSKDGQYVSSLTAPTASTPQCQFGDRFMYIGEKYLHDGVICECVIPPYLSCKPHTEI